MPHIHTEPNQHDITVSAFIVRLGETEPEVLVHMHRKHHILLQIGGHIELDETPWQAIAHELTEESGFMLEDLDILQPDDSRLEITHAVVHPVPVLMNTHVISGEHFHSDLCFAFVARRLPSRSVEGEESADLRWLTIAELEEAARQGIAAKDVVGIYKKVISTYLIGYHRVPAATYSLGKPRTSSM